MSERTTNILGSGPSASTGLSLPAMRVAALAAALCGATLGAGCGQKGPLYLPPAEKAPSHHLHAPAAPAAAPASTPASTPARP